MNRFEVTDLEIKARQILSDAVNQVAGKGYTRETARLMIAKAFIPEYCHAIPADKIVRIITAVDGLWFSDQPEVIRKELSMMVRDKALQTRRVDGTTLYEIAF